MTQRLESIFAQSYQDYEVILLDDASKDGSQEILDSYKAHPKVSHCVFNQQNSGSPFLQWQKGILLARGTYVWIAESDDYCEPHFLESLLPLLKEGSGIAYSQTIDVDEQGIHLLHRITYTKDFTPNIWENAFTLSGQQFVAKYLLEKNVIPNASAVLFERRLVTPLVFSKELCSMRMCGDWLFWSLLALHTQVSFIPLPLNYFRDHQGITRNHSSHQKRLQRIREESVVRFYLRKYGFVHNEINRSLQQHWFSYFKLKEVFAGQFYTFKLRKSKIGLLLSFLCYKFKRKLS